MMAMEGSANLGALTAAEEGSGVLAKEAEQDV